MNKILSYEISVFSLDAKVKIEARDKDGLEKSIRYCARPPFKSENIRINGHLDRLSSSKTISRWAIIYYT